MDWLKKLLGQSKIQTKAVQGIETIGTENSKSDNVISIDDPVFEASFSSRDKYWNKIGKIDEDVIAYLVSPQFQGAPPWPTTRQSFKIIRTDDTVIIASDGLSDPFVDTDMKSNGLECEVFIETSELKGLGFNEIKNSWQFSAIENWARNVADYGGINHQVNQYGVLSVELPLDSPPDDFLNANGNVGFLVNLKTDVRDYDITDSPLSPIKIISLTAIRPDELKFVMDGGQAARDNLAEKLHKSGYSHTSNSNRNSVLD